MQRDDIERFLGVPGHGIKAIHFLDKEGQKTKEDGEVEEVILELVRREKVFRCGCGREFRTYYDVRDRFARDLPWGPWSKVTLMIPRFRVECPECGVKTEPLDWLVGSCWYTQRLADAVALACREVRSISAIAEAFNLNWRTVRDIDRQALQKELDPPDFSGVRHLALDEFSIRKRHTYGTIFLDVERKRVLWVCATREKQAVLDVFHNVFGKEICAGIEAVSMDWWEGYERAVQEAIPHAAIVWDLFHIIKKYNQEVVDRIRIDESKKCETDEERRALKGTKYLLLKNPENLKEDEPARLKDLLAVNRSLFVVYVLRDALKKLWDYRLPKRAETWFRGWYDRAIRSRIEPLKKFARSLKDRLHGIIAHSRFPIHTGILEGINNKVKVIKRIAYGFRDDLYFFLKIRAHFPGEDPL